MAAQHRWDTIAVVGVGLIGGSVGLAVRQRGLARRVVGIGRRMSSLNKALDHKTVDEVTTDLPHGVAKAQLIVVCSPVQKIPEHVQLAAQNCPAGARITDAGSVKCSILSQLAADLNNRLGREVSFVGSHPLAGSEKTGPEHAQADLLENRVVVVTPEATADEAAVADVEAFWASLGGRVIRMSPDDHDAALSATSHLPHLAAAALAAATPEDWLHLTAGGWADTTRIAAGDPELWRQILTGNQSHVLQSLDKFAKVLSAFREAIAEGDQKRILELLDAGKNRRDALGG